MQVIANNATAAVTTFSIVSLILVLMFIHVLSVGVCGHRGDEGDGFGMVETQTAGKTFLREEAGVVEDKLVDFAGREVYGTRKR